MKKVMAGLVLATLSAVAQADDLADGIKAWEAQDFRRAHQLLGKLAEAGDAEAQLMVGEMTGFGEGVAENPALAERWLNRAKAGGNPAAADSLATLHQRAQRKQEIATYVRGRYGAQLTLEQHGCVRPAIPSGNRTQTQRDMKAVRDTFEAWSTCYESYGKALAGRALPQDVARLMSLSELQQARAALDKANAAVAAASLHQAMEVVASYNAWATNSRNYAVAMQKRLSDWVELARHDSDIGWARYRDSLAERTARPR